MLTYQQYEKAVFDWLMAKRELDKDFTFSTRVRSSVGAEKDYFIGTEKSNYFGFTLWDISVSYPGSSMDLIDFFFEDVHNSFKFVIECRQTNNPKGKQNESALKLIQLIREQIGTFGTIIYESKENGKDYNFKIRSPKAEYDSLSEMLKDLDVIMSEFIPVVQRCIEVVKKSNNEFEANRISIEDFENHFHKKTLSRIEKHSVQSSANNPINFNDFLLKFKKNELDFYISELKEIATAFNLKSGDQKLVFNVHYTDDYLSFNVGQRYCMTLHRNNSKGNFGFISTFSINENSEQFPGKSPKAWYTHTNDLNELNKYKSEIYKAIQIELNRSNRSGFRKYNKDEFESLILNNQLRMNSFSNNEGPLNQILYGPPGTGKTYKTINKAIKIIDPTFNFNIERKDLLEEFHRHLKKGNIFFTTFHQSMSYEDFIEGIKPSKSNDGGLTYEIEDGIFKLACANAGYLCYKKSIESNSEIKSYTFDDLYDAFIDYYQEQLNNQQVISLKTLTGKEVTIIDINSNQSIKARALNSIATKNPAPLTKENLQKLYDKFSDVSEINNLKQVQETVEVTPRTTEFYAVFKGLKDFENKIFKPDELEVSSQVEVIDDIDKLTKFNAGVFKNAIKQFSKITEPVVLIIDEINRGNVSAIFGELITLIEDSKRLGTDEFLELTLPYSKKKFSVPHNLHIIGTMNTADRSVEALDTALRRRFSFVEMLPDASKLEGKKIQGIHLEVLLSTINERIEVLVDRDHTIGHAFLINAETIEDLRNTFGNKIIPLLQEYFYGNYQKMEMVIGSAFFNITEANKVRFAVKTEDFDADGKVYHIIDVTNPEVISDAALIEALNNLIQGA